MRELALHILDIAQNSIAARASLIEIKIEEELANDRFTITLTDDGRGISENDLQHVADPFFTTRKTRGVGLGLSLLGQAAERTGGKLVVSSRVGVGTKVDAVFQHSHIDRAPLGDIQGTILALIVLNPQVDFIYNHTLNGRTFTLDTRVIKGKLGEVPISHAAVVGWIRDFITAGLEQLQGGRANEITG